MAHAALADCYNQLGTVMVGTGSPARYRPLAAASVIKALQIDAGLAEAHATLGYVRHYDLQWEEAEREFVQAIRLNPSYSLAHVWYANLLAGRRRFDAWFMAPATSSVKTIRVEFMTRLYFARRLRPVAL